MTFAFGILQALLVLRIILLLLVANQQNAVVDIVVVALAVAGLAGLATSSDAGPLALMTPTLLSLADRNLYAAKHAGRDRVVHDAFDR